MSDMYWELPILHVLQSFRMVTIAGGETPALRYAIKSVHGDRCISSQNTRCFGYNRILATVLVCAFYPSHLRLYRIHHISADVRHKFYAGLYERGGQFADKHVRFKGQIAFVADFGERI